MYAGRQQFDIRLPQYIPNRLHRLSATPPSLKYAVDVLYKYITWVWVAWRLSVLVTAIEFVCHRDAVMLALFLPAHVPRNLRPCNVARSAVVLRDSLAEWICFAVDARRVKWMNYLFIEIKCLCNALCLRIANKQANTQPARNGEILINTYLSNGGALISQRCCSGTVCQVRANLTIEAASIRP